MSTVAVNFGLVHAPAEFDYDFNISNLADEIAEQLTAANEDWEETFNAFTEEELHFLRWQICWKAMARAKQLPPDEFANVNKTTIVSSI